LREAFDRFDPVCCLNAIESFLLEREGKHPSRDCVVVYNQSSKRFG
jgi:hypothetical protein